MWRGYHKLGPDVFERLTCVPSTYPTSSVQGRVDLGPGLFALVLDDIIPDALLLEIEQLASDVGYEDALLNTGNVKQEAGVHNAEARKSKRAVFTSQECAGKVWDLVREFLPPLEEVPGPRWKGWESVGVNPVLRVLSYSSSDFFETHMDGSYADDETKTKSFLTLQVYLNDGGGHDFKGGGTRFFIQPPKGDPEGEIITQDVVPKKGRVLLFQHNIWHEGERIVPKSGTKRVLRTEIMFAKQAR